MASEKESNAKKNTRIRFKHLQDMKIANSEQIAAFIKSYDAFFENETKEKF